MSFNDNKDPMEVIKNYQPQSGSIWANFTPINLSDGINMMLDKIKKQGKQIPHKLMGKITAKEAHEITLQKSPPLILEKAYQGIRRSALMGSNEYALYDYLHDIPEAVITQLKEDGYVITKSVKKYRDHGAGEHYGKEYNEYTITW